VAWLTDIRTATITALSGVTTGAVEDSRVRPLTVGSADGATTADTFPKVVVASRRLRREPRGVNGRYMEQTAEIVLQCMTTGLVADSADVVAACETLDDAAFSLLQNSGTWRALFTEPPRVLSSDVDVTLTGAHVLCSIVQTWEVRGRVERTAGTGDALATVVTTLTDTPKPTVITTVDDLDA